MLLLYEKLAQKNLVLKSGFQDDPPPKKDPPPDQLRAHLIFIENENLACCADPQTGKHLVDEAEDDDGSRQQ